MKNFLLYKIFLKNNAKAFVSSRDLRMKGILIRLKLRIKVKRKTNSPK